MSRFSVPIIDLSNFQGNGCPADREIGSRLVAACKSSGFAILTGTIIGQSDIDSMLAEAKRFFTLPTEIKEKIRHPAEVMNHVGWSAIERENLNQDDWDTEANGTAHDTTKKPPDYKESLEVWDVEHPFLHNLFLPEKDLPGFRSACETYWAKMHRLSQVVLRAIACGLPGDMPPSFFDAYHQEKTCQLRLLHYPSAPRSYYTTKRYTPLNSHTDFCCFTLLIQDDVGGLQVEDPNEPGVFSDVPTVPGGICFNVADLLQRWSNDELKSSKHRVVPPKSRASEDPHVTPDRYSLPYFVCADWTKKIECLPACCSPDRPPKYERTSFLLPHVPRR